MTLSDFAVSLCVRCGEVAVWKAEQLISPSGVRLGTQAPEEMPPRVKALYDEAREVSTISPRSAAALLRLALQYLVDELVPGQDDTHTKIGTLVASGLDPRVQKAMDTLRVIGNNAVHPGQIDLDEDPTLVPGLFNLLILIVDHLIVRPAEVDRLYGSLPPGAVQAIERRDAAKPTA